MSMKTEPEPKKMTQVELFSRIDYPCVCGAQCALGYDASDHPVLLHPLPQCEAFCRVRPAEEYLAEVRSNLGLRF